MKYIHTFLKHIIFFSLSFYSTLSPTEYRYLENTDTPESKINFIITKEKPLSPQPFPSHMRYWKLYNLMKNNAIQQIPPANTSHQNFALTSNLSALSYVYNGFKTQRQNIIKELMYNNPNVHAIYSKNYSIPKLSQQYLTTHNIAPALFTSCEGNTLQHAIHQEFIVLTDTTAHLWNDKKNSNDIKQLTSVIADFASAGISFNHIGEIQKAMSLADAGWAILDCIQAAGEGFIEGITSVQYTVLHPIETAQHFTQTITSCGYYLAIAFNEIYTVTNAIKNGDFDIAYNKHSMWTEQFRNITHILSEQSKKLKFRDIVKAITRSAVECYATTRALNGFNTFFKHAQKITQGAQESTLLMSTAGIPVRVAQEVATKAPKLPRSNDKLLQVLSKFKNQKIRVENNTFLLDKRGLKHILERHHPLYWDGSLAATQTFLPKNTTVSNIVKIIKQVIKQNKQLILQNKLAHYQIHGIIKGIKYTVGIGRGRIGQLFIPSHR